MHLSALPFGETEPRRGDSLHNFSADCITPSPTIFSHKSHYGVSIVHLSNLTECKRQKAIWRLSVLKCPSKALPRSYADVLQKIFANSCISVQCWSFLAGFFCKQIQCVVASQELEILLLLFFPSL